MKKRKGKIIALLLSLVLLLTGCASTEGLKKVPGGQRPESLDKRWSPNSPAIVLSKIR